mmetsp:Transcript_106629/g.296738  ORF Transcript_106629/g.296738 Transcript_106629/m.296738 type:complete len:259 (-) Transcript_106629:1595-2371(-)
MHAALRDRCDPCLQACRRACIERNMLSLEGPGHPQRYTPTLPPSICPLLPDQILNAPATAPPWELFSGHRLEVVVVLLRGAVEPSSPCYIFQVASVRHDVRMPHVAQLLQIAVEVLRVLLHKRQGVDVSSYDRSEVFRMQLDDLTGCVRSQRSTMHPLHPQHRLCNPRACSDSCTVPHVQVPVLHVPRHDEEHPVGHLATQEELFAMDQTFLSDGLGAQLRHALAIGSCEVVEERSPREVRAVQLLVQSVLEVRRQQV